MNILINDKLYKDTQNVQNLDHFKQILLDLIDIQYSPLQALKTNMISFFDLVETFCKIERRTKKGGNKAKLTREITKINGQRKFWAMIEEKETFIRKYYDYVLSIEKLDRLRGFGFSNLFGDKIKGNSESQRISYKHSD